MCWGFSYQKTDGLIDFSCANPVFPQILTKMTDIDLLWAGKLAGETDFFPQAPLNQSSGFIISLLPGAGDFVSYPLESWQTQVWRDEATGISLPPAGGWRSLSGLAEHTAGAPSRDGICLWVYVCLGVFLSLMPLITPRPARTFPFS